jgi:hypothetical protein
MLIYIFKISFMLKSKNVSIDINKGNFPFYRKISSDISIGDTFDLSISKLSKGSNINVIAICDICKNEISIKYRLYNIRYEKNGSFACSKKCASKRTQDKLMEKYCVKNIAQVPEVKSKIKKTNLEKFGSEHYFGSDESKIKNKLIFLDKLGVDNPLKSGGVKNKMKKNNLEKWGVEWTLQNDQIRERIKRTNLENWGTETPSKNNEVKNKIISTNKERYGSNSAMCNKEVQEKSKDTLIKNYGVDNPLKSPIIRERLKKTNLEKLGVEYPTQSDFILDRIKNNNLLKWGTSHPHQSELYRKGNTIIGNHLYYLKYKGDQISIFNCDLGLDHTFEIKSDNFYARNRQNVSLCTICNPISDTRSQAEKSIHDFITSIYTGKVINSHREKYEIDIFIPDLGLGFEYNGLYWHSEPNKDKWYHFNKTKYFESKNIRIIHIWEDDWISKPLIIKSQISNLLYKSNKIHSRKTEVKVVSDIDQVKRFLNDNHIQGYVSSNIKLGLYYNNELVSLMTFDKFEGRKKMTDGEWNLSRFCNKIEFSVMGGASKLLSFFIKNYLPKRIVSYADRDWSSGNLYKKLGFSLIKQSNPDYKYVKEGERLHKGRFKKSKLKYNSTESEYTKSMGIHRIWDCGKLKFELIFD